MTADKSSLGSHVAVALSTAVLLVLCQVAVETVLISVYAGRYLLSPSVFFGAQMYDFCVKLFLWAPGASGWFRGGELDSFLPAGIGPKVSLGAALLGPNLLAALLLGSAIAVLRWVLGRRPQPRGALVALVFIGLTVHFLSWLSAVHMPKRWSATVLFRQGARVFVWEGTWVSIVALIAGAALAVLLARLRPAARWTVSAALGVALGGSLLALAPGDARSSGALTAARATPPSRLADNLILISIDSLRVDHVGSYGHPKDTTPAIDRIGRGGVRFANASSSSSWTLPSHMSMLTGRDALGHGVISLSDSLSPAIPTLAAELKKAGLVTAGIVSTPVLNSRFGFGHGFDLYDDHTIPSSNTFDAVADEPAPQVEKLATDWLRLHAGGRFFLFLHFWDVHYDYIPPPPYDTMFDPDYEGTVSGKDFFSNKAINKHLPQRDVEHLLALYDGEIRWVDDHIGRILSVVEQLGLADKTAVVITSDHGDEFFEHGFKGHGRTLYDEVTHIPLVMAVPGVSPGQVIDTPVSLVDLMPTALSILGVESPAGMSGADLLQRGEDSRLEQRPGVLGWLCSLTHRSDCQAMRKSRVGTLIHHFQPLGIEFYLSGDLRQKDNLANDGAGWPRDEQMRLLERQLNAPWRSYRQLGEDRPEIELDAATRDRLHDLGYTD